MLPITMKELNIPFIVLEDQPPRENASYVHSKVYNYINKDN